MRIVGVDPGTLVVGYGVVDYRGSRLSTTQFGVIRAPRGNHVAERLGFIQKELEEIIAGSKPDVVAIEKVFVRKSIPSAIRIGEARGVIMAVAAGLGVPVVEYTPAEVKKSVENLLKALKEKILATI